MGLCGGVWLTPESLGSTGFRGQGVRGQDSTCSVLVLGVCGLEGRAQGLRVQCSWCGVSFGLRGQGFAVAFGAWARRSHAASEPTL